jgi:hypothetical protein
MVTPTPAPGAAPGAPDRQTWTRIRDLGHDLHKVYVAAFGPAFDEAEEIGCRFELPDGTRLDPTVAADAVACRAVNDALAATVDYHLPGAELVGRADDAPTVIAATWHYQATDTAQLLEITIEWDCTYDFGDPDGLVVAVDRIGVAR